jgi:SNF2 family DNA or RNA helicase
VRPDARADLVRQFNGWVDDDGSENDGDLDILVGTYQTLGTGLTLVRAFRVILTEPDYVAMTEEQANARICRIGQQNPETFSYRLLTSGSELEGRILKRQANRRKLKDGAYAKRNAEKGRPVDHNPFVDTMAVG